MTPEASSRGPCDIQRCVCGFPSSKTNIYVFQIFVEWAPPSFHCSLTEHHQQMLIWVLIWQHPGEELTISCSAWLSLILSENIPFFYYVCLKKRFTPKQKCCGCVKMMTRTWQWIGGEQMHTHTHTACPPVFFFLLQLAELVIALLSLIWARRFHSHARPAAGSPSVVAGVITSRRLLSTCLHLRRTPTNHAAFIEPSTTGIVPALWNKPSYLLYVPTLWCHQTKF